MGRPEGTMVTLDWQQTRRNGTTLVELLVRSDTTTGVRIESTLTPVWPPRRQGEPVAGWDGNRFEGEIEAGEWLVLGYATPAEPRDQPATVEAIDSNTSTEHSPRSLVRALGEARPPLDAVLPPASAASKRADLSGDEACLDSDAGMQDPRSERNALAVSEDGRGEFDRESSEYDPDRDSYPSIIEAWFTELEQRVRRAEQLSSLEEASEAKATVRAAGGIEVIAELREQLATDRRQLDRIATRQQELSRRLETVDIPVSALDRIE